MKLCVIGLGYIGLPTALLLSSSNEVVGVDTDPRVVTLVNDKVAPFQEPGLEALLAASSMTASQSPQQADGFIICVPSPLHERTKTADLTYVKQALKSIAPHLQKSNLVIIETTVPPGTCKKNIVPFLEKTGLRVGKDIYLAYCPERAMPTKTLWEMANSDRIIGGINEKSAEIARKLYSSFVKGTFRVTDISTAEFVKLMENTYRDVTIALANEFATIAEEAGISIWEAISLANYHPRVDLPNPGPGVGGHCIPIDPYFLTETTTQYALIRAARDVNDYMPSHVFSKLQALLNGIKKPTITIFGVSYKGNVDDTRMSPATKLIKLAEEEGFEVRIYDPHVRTYEYGLSSLDAAVTDTDCIVILADHDEFRHLDFEELTKKARHKNVVDTRNIIAKSETYNLISLGVAQKKNV